MGHPACTLNKAAHRARHTTLSRGRVLLLLAALLAFVPGAAADNAAFDLIGPKVDVKVQRAGVTLSMQMNICTFAQYHCKEPTDPDKDKKPDEKKEDKKDPS